MTNKSSEVNKLIDFFQNKFGIENISIKDFWDEEPDAIGFVGRDNSFLVYVAIYEENNFYVALEGPATDNEMPYADEGDFNNVSLSELEIIIITHLKIKT